MAYVLTFVSPHHNLSDDQINAYKSFLTDLDDVKITDQHWLEKEKAVDLFIAQKLTRRQLGDLRKKCNAEQIDVFVVAAENRQKKLLIADMDSTILTGETLDELAEHMGLKDKIAVITERAMRGELNFHEAIRERVKMLKGLDEKEIEKTISNLAFNKGAKSLITTMKKAGSKTVLVSGGFKHFTDWAAEECGFDHTHSNVLRMEDDALTGEVKEPILDAQTKEDLLIHYTRIYGFDDAQTMAVGDGANDLKMLKRASVGVGFIAKPKVARAVENSIRHTDLSSLLYIQGYESHDIIEK